MSASGVLIICKFDRNGVYPVNKFVQSLGPPSYMYPWSGGILALKWDTPATKNLRGGLRKPMKMESWLDMTPADSCRMLDSFRWNGKNAALYELERLRNMYPQWPTVDGVKINCICDYAVRPKFENVTVSLLPCDGIDCEPCKLLGLPIVYRRVTPGSVTTSGDGRAKSRAQVEQRGRMWNTNAAFLQMKLLGGDSQPLDFQRQTGNMVIFRTDKKSLSIGQVEAIVAFMESLVGDKIRAYERAPFVTKMLAIRTTYVEGMMKEKFLAFLTRFNVGLQKRVGEVVGSPYE
ncbi:hypothetical protein NKR23_g11661 [Pleurostoma richardsiae]|uniref:Uncharacterized protein n=1 Tax=Pleurostoma richardsiae TaxID=41990 RepID=A0AA38VGM3_9PEZI|nr:hypothetical protein NKR23_g11661 [Pleurostoma richardsiae]